MPTKTAPRQLSLLSLHDWRETVLEILAHHGWRVLEGIPCLCIARPRPNDPIPEVMFIELATEDAKVPGEIAWWLSVLEANGNECHIYRPSDLPAFTERLKRGRP